jgi:hypothetical protein
MKTKYIFAVISLVIACGAGWAAEPVGGPPVVSETTLTLLKEAQTVARQNKPDESIAAYAKVFAAADLTTDQRIAAHLDLGRVLSAKGPIDAAAAEYDQALAVPGLDAVQKIKILNTLAQLWFNSNFKGAWASYTTAGIDKAADLYRQIGAMPEASPADKVAAYNSLANCQLERMEIAAANATLDEALKLPGLKEADLFAARKNKADALYRQLEFARALPIYEGLWSTNLTGVLRSSIENRIVEIVSREKGGDEAFRLLKEKFQRGPLGLAEFCSNSGKQAEAIRLYDGVLADGQADYRTRIDTLEKLMFIFGADSNFDAFLANAERRIASLIAAEPKASEIYGRLGSRSFSRLPIAGTPRFKRWLDEKLLATTPRSPKDRAAAARAQFEELLKQRDFAPAMDVARTLLADTNTPPAFRLTCNLSLVVFDTKGNASGVIKKVQSALDQDATLRTNPVARAEGLLNTARIAMDMRYEKVARVLYAERDKMLVQAERRSLPCTFLEKAPKDITAFMNSAYFKDPKNRGVLDRKYGDNVQFLLDTDAALTGRKVTEKKDDFVPTEFVAVCDADGIKLFFFATTTKAKDVADGLVAMGGYETYLAAGPDAPYHCFLIDLPPGEMSDDFVTQYKNKTFRRARQKENTATIEHQVLENGVATLLTVSWAAFFNAIPQNGDAWDFEPIHWEQGGYSWGGSQSVHNRSSFGSLIFANMTPANVNAIKRRLIPVAVAAYRKELSSENGYVEIWQDPELGDRTFYFEKVKPLTDKLSQYLGKVKPGMTAEEVDWLYAEAVPSWMNIKYIVADLRRDYLDARRVAGQ